MEHTAAIILVQIIFLEDVDDRLDDDVREGDHEADDEPRVDQLDVGRPRQGVGDGDEEGGQNEEGRHVHHHDGREVLWLKKTNGWMVI